jgi:hypothetical protein
MTPAMKEVTVFGLACSPADEPAIVGRIERSLAKIKRSMSKATQRSLLDGLKPFVHEHYYWNLNRDCGVYFELLRNEDLEGKRHAPRNPEMGLLLLFVLQEHAFRNAAPTKKALEYVFRILGCLGVDHERIAEGSDRECVEAEMLRMR